MGRPPKKWPTFALENLEDSLFKLKELEAKADAAEVAVVMGDNVVAMRELSEIRSLALKCLENLVRSRAGEYEQQQREPKWSKPTNDQTAKAVQRVMATRRS